MKSQNKAFFFDRDGIVNVLLPNNYVRNYSEFVFNREFFDIFSRIVQAGFLTFLITNQQGIGKGLMTEEDLLAIHNEMNNEIILQCGKSFDKIYYCSALESENSPRRKPNPGMLVEAIDQYDIEINSSFMIGDSIKDAQAAKQAGIKSILIGDYSVKDADIVFATLKDFAQGCNRFI